MGQRSLLQDALCRADAIVHSVIVVVTHHMHMPHVRAQVRSLSLSKRVVLLSEPDARNTAPAIALALFYLQTHAEGARTICMPADHVITPLADFKADASAAVRIIDDGRIAIFGIKPDRALTGYGYIERGAQCAGGYVLQKFHEKPDQQTAYSYFKDAHFFWNSGMYAFTVPLLWEELLRYEPRITSALQHGGADIFAGVYAEGANGTDAENTTSTPISTNGTPTTEAAQRHSVSAQDITARLQSVYAQMPAISIDYAVAERSERVAMVAAHFKWSDVGSWDEIAQLVEERRGDGLAPITNDDTSAHGQVMRWRAAHISERARNDATSHNNAPRQGRAGHSNSTAQHDGGMAQHGSSGSTAGHEHSTAQHGNSTAQHSNSTAQHDSTAGHGGSDTTEHDNGNAPHEQDTPTSGSVLSYNSARNIIIGTKRVALCGINDIIVVTEGDTILLCKRGQSQHVKEIAIEHHNKEDATNKNA